MVRVISESTLPLSYERTPFKRIRCGFDSRRRPFGVNTTMTQYEALNGKTVEVTDTKVKTYKKDGDLRVDRVYLKVEDDEIPKGKISINPTVSDTERATKVVNGREYDTETEKERDPTILEMDGQFPKIGQITDAVNEYGTIELTGLVRCVRDSDDDDWNMFIRTSELDKFSASVPEEDTAEKVEEEKDTAEEFVEDQTNIDTDEEEEDDEDDILFGEDE